MLKFATSWTRPTDTVAALDPCFELAAVSTGLAMVSNYRRDRFARVYLTLVGGAGGQTAVVQLYMHDAVVGQYGLVPVNGTGNITITEGVPTAVLVDVEVNSADLAFFVTTWTSGTVTAWIASN